MKNINEIFRNNENIYYAHGTGKSGNGINVVRLIFTNGLRCHNNQLNYTVIPLGLGGQINQTMADLLDNWPYASSAKIMIVSIPNKYRIFEDERLNTQGLEHIAYCYESINDGLRYVFPEFVYGCYEADKKKIVKNPKYYEFLPKCEQEEVFKVIRTRYIDYLQERVGLKKYKDIISNDFPEVVLPKDIDFENYDDNFASNLIKVTKKKRCSRK